MGIRRGYQDTVKWRDMEGSVVKGEWAGQSERSGRRDKVRGEGEGVGVAK